MFFNFSIAQLSLVFKFKFAVALKIYPSRLLGKREIEREGGRESGGGGG